MNCNVICDRLSGLALSSKPWLQLVIIIFFDIFVDTRRSWVGLNAVFFLSFFLLIYETRTLIADPKCHSTFGWIRVPEPRNNFKNNGTNFSRDRMGRTPAIRCFVKNFYMVAYVTKAGLGPEPEFELLFRSLIPWSGLIPGTTRICSVCSPLFRWPRLKLYRQVFAGRPVPSLFKFRRGVWRCRNLNGSLYDLINYIFSKHNRKDDWVKISSKSTKKQESRKFRHMQFSHIRT